MLGKGKGKGKGKANKKGQGENTDDDPEEEERPLEENIKEGMKKLRKSRDRLTSTLSNDEALDKVKKKQYLSKVALKEKEEKLVHLENTWESE